MSKWAGKDQRWFEMKQIGFSNSGFVRPEKNRIRADDLNTLKLIILENTYMDDFPRKHMSLFFIFPQNALMLFLSHRTFTLFRLDKNIINYFFLIFLIIFF